MKNILILVQIQCILWINVYSLQCQDRGRYEECYNCCITSCRNSNSSQYSSAITLPSRNMLDQLEPQHKILNLADICGRLDNAKFGDFKILMKSLSKRNSGKISFKQEKIASNRDFIKLVDHRNGPPDEKTIINFSTYFGEQTRSGRSSRSVRSVKQRNRKHERKNRNTPKESRRKNRRGPGKRLKLKVINKDGSAAKYWPWHVHITLSGSDQDECIGTLISSSIVLTSAHCFKLYDFKKDQVIDKLEDNGFINLYAGLDDTSQIQKRHEFPQVQKSQARRENIYVHPFWLSGSHDLAVIQLDPLQPFRLNTRVQPICLGDGIISKTFDRFYYRVWTAVEKFQKRADNYEKIGHRTS